MIITADLHLGMRMKNTPLIDVGGGYISVHTYATLSRLKTLFNYAISNKISEVVILGDIFHTPYPDIVTFTNFQYLLQSFRDHVEIFMISGNHDCDARYCALRGLTLSSFPLLNNCVIINKHVSVSRHTDLIQRGQDIVTGPDRCIYYPHSGYGEEFEIDGDVEEATLFGHGQLEGLKHNGFELESTGSAMLLTIEEAQRYDRVFLGHIHKPARIQKKGFDVTYPGSVFPCSFGEIHEKKGFCDLKNDEFIQFTDLESMPFYVTEEDDQRNGTRVILGEITVQDGKARVKWGNSKPGKSNSNDLLIVKVREHRKRGGGSDETKEIMQKFWKKGIVVSSYERIVEAENPRKVEVLESIKGDLNHEEIFEAYVNANYANHEHLRVVKSAGKRIIQRVSGDT